MSPSPDSFPRSNPSRRTRGVALITVLSLVVVVSLILVAFVAAMRVERTASFSYSQALSAEQVAQGGLRLVVAELQNEMSKDAAPDSTYPQKPLYTNVSSTNIMPQFVGTNSAMTNLVKISSTTAPFTGSLASGKLIASSVNTSTASQNGRYVDTNRWNLPQLGSFTNANNTPNWIIMTRAGATNGSGLSFGTTGNTANNPASGNTNYAIGRFAYAIYDVGGLLDITLAGYPSTLTPTQLEQIKGALAGVSPANATNAINQDDLVQWRNAASRLSYVDYVTNFLATNAAGTVYPGDNTFLSRQDLIKAAQGGIAGLTNTVLPYLTTFSRDRNAPGWGPTYNASSLGGSNTAIYAYKNNAAISNSSPFSSSNPNPNRFLPGVRFTSTYSITNYQSDGTSYTYGVEPGDELIQRRFPLSRLKWVGPNGPNGVAGSVVQACFGLIWGTSDDPAYPNTPVWKYVGSSGTTKQTRIKTLDEVASEGRAPNFFELLQAAVLRGSLGVNGNAGAGSGTPEYDASAQQTPPMFQILRMGAAAIDQADSDSYPTVIEYTQGSAPWLACGVESLPGIASITPVIGAEPGTQTTTQTSANAVVYLTFNLWNPHQTVSSPPRVRIRVTGSVAVYNLYGDSSALPDTIGSEPGFISTLGNQYLELTSTAASSFGTPATLLQTHVDTSSTSLGTTSATPSPSTSGVWVEAFTLGSTSAATNAAALRLRNFPFKLGTSSTLSNSQVNSVKINLGYNAASTAGNGFNAVMEYYLPIDTGGAWIPYQYATGINDNTTWFRDVVASLPIVSSVQRTSDGKYYANFISYLSGSYPSGWTVDSATGVVQNSETGDPWSTPGSGGKVHIDHDYSWDRSPIFASNDPRSTRFNVWTFLRGGAAATSAAQSTVLWPASNITAFPKGLGGGSSAVERKPTIFGDNYFPAQLARNNYGRNTAIADTNSNTVAQSGSSSETSYVDNDGLRRISDSGLFVDANGATGNPFERNIDKPVVLNRPFRTVGELGFVFRDGPWKTLDLFSSKSADSALLDIFSAQDSTQSFVTGKVNLNTRNQDVLKALLVGTVIDPVASISMDSTTAGKLATAISGFTSTNKIVNKSELATVVSPFLSPTTGGTSSGNFLNNDAQNIKLRREAFVRALGDVTQTRTWNLMIDLVAQSGRYGPSATALSQFTVESERRYWLHVAIDRFTGEVIDQRIEVVTE
ncbi:hypothetical protein DB345_07815 [Spartobacteria bacterium LR76]|nr:hypothetical protein DB345_07815 [Spartobacteria bacterium LR76]